MSSDVIKQANDDHNRLMRIIAHVVLGNFTHLPASEIAGVMVSWATQSMLMAGHTEAETVDVCVKNVHQGVEDYKFNFVTEGTRQ